MRAASFSLLIILCLLLAVAPAMADTLYNNGTFNGNTDAWQIDYGFAVSDSFTVPHGSIIEDFHLAYWTAAGNQMTSVDMAFGSTSFGGTYNTYGVSGSTLLGTNNFGFAVYQSDLTSGLSVPWSGAGYVSLQNACTAGGCSAGEPQIFWDENDGPSMAYANSVGSIGSEAFTLTSCLCCGAPGPDCGPPVPEPSSIMLFASGILGVVGVLRRKLDR
ncbi:MAG: PEP-CTERM sorting domain-containing protein [Candidatus Korobacteraceae bacterium]